MILEKRLIKIMLTNTNLMRDLQLVQQLNLPNWCIAAGYIRNYVWDYLHGYRNQTTLNDVDVLYFDRNNLSEDAEKDYEAQLAHKFQVYNWSCKNQARMHIRNDEERYHSINLQD